MAFAPNTVEELQRENQQLLFELEVAYKNLEQILEQTSKEKEIAYRELQANFEALQTSYAELTQKENLLVHLEKLSSIGQFIAEIIHELKNPLTIISAHTEMALMLNPSDELEHQLKQISKQVLRMSGYLNRFRSMAYKGQEDFIVFDLNQNLYDCLSTLEMIKPKNVEIKVRLWHEPLLVKGDPYQANQIFLNLAKNAFDALKEQGDTLRVRSQAVTSERARDRKVIGEVFCLSKNRWEKILDQTRLFALIEFEDNGEGISEEHLPNIFQAFYTTKKRGKGTGLGMTICSDIAKRHGGNIAVNSARGKGTRFQVLLPLAREDINIERNEYLPRA